MTFVETIENFILDLYTPSLIADIILALIILWRLSIGIKRGAVKEVGSFCSLIISFTGSNMLAKGLAPVLAGKYLVQFVNPIFEKAREELRSADVVGAISNIIDNADIPSFLKDGIDEYIISAAETGMSVLNMAVIAVAQRLAFIFLLVISFIILYIICNIAFKDILDPLIRHLPIVKNCNELLGAILGGLVGLLLTALIFLAVRYFIPSLFKPDAPLSPQAVEDSYLLKYYFKYLSWILF